LQKREGRSSAVRHYLNPGKRTARNAENQTMARALVQRMSGLF
jgi:hypothetical protein